MERTRRNQKGDVAILFAVGVSTLILGMIVVLQLIASNKARFNLNSYQSLDSFLMNEVYAWHGFLKKKAQDGGSGTNLANSVAQAPSLIGKSRPSVNGANFCGVSNNGGASVCVTQRSAFLPPAGSAGEVGSWIPMPEGGNLFGLRGPMVWTGLKVAMWGGYSPATNSLTNKGAFYDPASGVFTPISQTGAPTYASFYSLVWTGSKLIAWSGCPNGNCGGSHVPRFPRGGIFDPTNLGNGGIYDPESHSWSSISVGPDTDNALADVAIAAWTGSKAMFWSSNGNEGALLDPNTKEWSVMPKIPFRDSLGHTSNTGSGFFGFQGSANLWTGSQLLVWGGMTMNTQENYAATQEGAIYDPAENKWSSFPIGENTPSPRFFANAVWTGTNAIFWGGMEYPSGKRLNTGGIYDPVTKKWKAISNVNAPDGAMGNVVWDGKQMIGWGGYIGTGGAWVDTGWTYNPKTDTWTSLPKDLNAPLVNGGHQAAVWTGSKWVVNGFDKCSFFEIKKASQ